MLNFKFSIKIINKIRIKQQILDKLICEKHNTDMSSLNYFISQQLALLVEIAELAQELQSFKHWKTHKVVDYSKAREEYIDCIHFFFSLANLYGIDFKNFTYLSKKHPLTLDLSALTDLNTAILALFHLAGHINEYKCDDDQTFVEILLYLEFIANYLDFTYPLFYKEYYSKYSKN